MMLRNDQETVTIPIQKKVRPALPKGYRNLTYEERCQIEALKKSGISYS